MTALSRPDRQADVISGHHHSGDAEQNPESSAGCSTVSESIKLFPIAPDASNSFNAGALNSGSASRPWNDGANTRATTSAKRRPGIASEAIARPGVIGVEHVLMRAGDPGAAGDATGRSPGGRRLPASRYDLADEARADDRDRRDASPTLSWPRACHHRHARRKQRVPVGERSILPGRMATAELRPGRSLSSKTSGRRRRRRKYGPSRHSPDGAKPSCSLAAAMIFMPVSAMLARLALGASVKPSFAASTMTKLSPPIGDIDGQRAEPGHLQPSRPACPRRRARCARLMRSALPLRHSAADLDQPARRLQRRARVSGSGIGTMPVSSSTVGDADRVRARHGRRILRLHDDAAHLRAWGSSAEPAG